MMERGGVIFGQISVMPFRNVPWDSNLIQFGEKNCQIFILKFLMEAIH
jgi:hypothetical protein